MQLFDSFEERFGYAVRRAIPMQGYQAMLYFEEAVKRAAKAGESNPFDPDVIVKYLESINKDNPLENTPFGKMAFNEYHETILDHENGFFPYVYFQWVGDRQQVIVWPEKYKTGDLQLPPWLEAALPK
jgi:branched-chain amino acid transport system substrate-binding protein